MTQPHRLGPRPLPLLMAIQTLTALGSLSALPLLRNGSLSWSPTLRSFTDELNRAIRQTTPEAFAAAVEREAAHRLAAFAAGVRAYRASPASDRPAEPPAIWQRGAARLLDYGATDTAAADGWPVIAIPSLVNRGYILDLTARRSLMRALAARGFRPLLVDWGSPDESERAFTLTDYVDGYLGEALGHAVDVTGRPAAVLGYCMGGNLGLALTTRHAERVRALALLATPWDFQAGHAQALPFLAAVAPALEAIIASLGFLPVDVLQSLFTGLNPALTGSKLRSVAERDPASRQAREFVRLEDWLNDGVPLAGPVARECLFGWYMDNTVAAGNWRVGGQAIDPAGIEQPALVAVPSDDYIVPPASARPLADALPNAKLKTVKAGHIGMVAGGRAKSMLYTPLADWLAAILT